MSWYDKMKSEELEEAKMALATLGHVKFFERYLESLKEEALNSFVGDSDENLVYSVRRFQAQHDLVIALNQEATNAASHLANIDGDENVQDFG